MTIRFALSRENTNFFRSVQQRATHCFWWSYLTWYFVLFLWRGCIWGRPATPTTGSDSRAMLILILASVCFCFIKPTGHVESLVFLMLSDCGFLWRRRVVWQACTSKTLILIYETTRYHVPKTVILIFGAARASNLTHSLRHVRPCN